MIGRLTGRLAAKHPPQVMVDCNGVAYELDVPMSTFYSLPATGEPVTLHTHLVVREDAHALYGFYTLEERAQAVAMQESARLTRVPGIGKKTAERLLLELKGKLAEAKPAGAGATDVLNALLALGYSEKEALGATRGLAPGIPVAEGIRTALRTLARP